MQRDAHGRMRLYEVLIAALIVVLVLVPHVLGAKTSEYAMGDDGKPVPTLSMDDLQKPGMRIAVLTGSELIDTIQNFFPDAQSLEYDAFADVFNALDTGKADAALGFAPHLTIVPQTYPGMTNIREPVTQYGYGFATQKNERGALLRDQLNTYFGELVASGRFQELKEKWDASEGEQCMGEYVFTGKNGTLRIATMGTWSPMSFYAGDELTGMFIEMANGFCQKYGYTPTYSSMPYASEIAGLNAGTYDMIADNIAWTTERLESVNLTDPLFTDEVYVFVPAKASEGEQLSGVDAFAAQVASSFEKNFVREDRWKLLLSGLGVTVALSVLCGLIGTALGAAVCFLRMRRSDVAKAFADLYVHVFRGVPIVVLLLVLNYLIFTSPDFPPFWVCVVAFSLDFSAYASEIMRKGIEAVPKGQLRAARALGFGSFHGFRKVVLPQALINMLPVYGGQFIAMVKLTSVAGYISVMDLTRASDIIRSRTYEAFFPLILTAVIYYLMCALLISLLQVVERRIQPGAGRAKKVRQLMGQEAPSGGRRAVVGGSSGTAAASSALRPASGAETADIRPVFSVSHLAKRFGDVEPLRDVSCDIWHGDVVAVIGPSGAGKSTFISQLNQLETADAGTIRFEGEDILASGYDLNGHRRRVGMVFQSFNLFPHLSIIENVMLAQVELLHRTRSEALERGMELLEAVGLSDKALNYPEELSGGQQQRVAIARAVAMDPEVLLFDEPTSALDPTTIGEVLSVMRGLAADGMTMVVVTHELGFAKSVSNRVFYLDEGVIYEQGSPKQVFDAPQREKTRQFVNHLKVLRLEFVGGRFDVEDAYAGIESFGRRHLIDRRTVLAMEMVVEELVGEILLGHFADNMRVELVFEMREETGKLGVRARFAGDDYDPLERGDELSVTLIRYAVEGLRYYTQDGYGVVEGLFRSHRQLEGTYHSDRM